MQITDLLSASRMRLHVAVADKQDALDQLIALTRQDGLLTDSDAFRRAVLEREEQVSTAIQEGIAVPHGRGASVRRTGLAVMTLNRGVEWGAMDGQPSDLLFLIAATEDGTSYMEILSRLMSLLMDREFQKQLRAAAEQDGEEELAVLRGTEAVGVDHLPAAVLDVEVLVLIGGQLRVSQTQRKRRSLRGCSERSPGRRCGRR